MPPPVAPRKRLVNRPKYWSKLIAEQEACGQRVRPYCRERGIGEPSFYYWRKRLRKSGAVGIALLETMSAKTTQAYRHSGAPHLNCHEPGMQIRGNIRYSYSHHTVGECSTGPDHRLL